ncbi:MAG TPA: cobalamin biosynthesis protein P47K [Coriobacteriia bacterium]|nr:cobalamin biosynthesis protein P47K [Coriobacteriia bacterium]
MAAQTDSSAPPGIATAKVAILENEIGEVSVDSSVFSGLAGVGAGGAGGGIQLRELFSGCVCCSLAGELVDAVRDLQATVHPEWLIIEATGLAIPESAADLLRKAITDLEGLLTVVLVDAARFSVLEKISPLIGKQPKTADVLLLNKVDLVDEAVRGQVTSRLREINASASILEVVASEPIAQDVLAEMIKGA